MATQKVAKDVDGKEQDLTTDNIHWNAARDSSRRSSWKSGTRT